MAVYKRGGTWWYEFVFASKRIRESAKTSRKTIAMEAERLRRLELEKTLAGIPIERRQSRIQSVDETVDVYLEHYASNHRKQSVLFARGRLAHVKRMLGHMLLADLTENAVREYIRDRLVDGVCGRTINMEVGELSRAIGKRWSTLWPRLRKLEERKDVGKALSNEEEVRLLEAIPRVRSPYIGTFVRVALLTGMRSAEITALKWGQIDFLNDVITVGRAKTSSGTGRQIPINQELRNVLAAHAAWFTQRFTSTEPMHYLFPFGKPMPTDPSRPITDISSAWDSLRRASNVYCRVHDLRHSAATKMAEAGVPESTMLALLGHMSRAMLERYSHIRMVAKRKAVESLTTAQTVVNGVPTNLPTSGPDIQLQ